MSKVAVEIAEALAERVREEAARTGRPAAEILEAAIRRYIGPGVIDKLWARSELSEDEATRIALEETDAHRAEGR